MPEGRITAAKLRDHLRRMWIVYLVGFAVCIFLNNLVYTITRPSFSEDETLKIMLLNAEIPLSEAEILEDVRHLGFQAVELVPLAGAAEDATSKMLVRVQLTAGFGDIYITDEAGFELLAGFDACLDMNAGLSLSIGNGTHMVAAKNGTNTRSAVAALNILAEKME